MEVEYARLENVVMENIHYNGTAGYRNEAFLTVPDKNFNGCTFDFRCMRDSDFIKNVIIRDVFTCSGAEVKMVKENFDLNIK